MTSPIRTLVAGAATLHHEDPVLEPVVALAERTGAELHLVHAYEPDAEALSRYRRAGFVGPEPERFYSEDLEEELADDARTLGRPAGIRCHAVPGAAAEVLPSLAAGLDADLVVVGPSRRGRIAGAVLGTTAQAVLRASAAPVLLLRGKLPDRPVRVLLATDLTVHSAAAHARGLDLVARLAGVHATLTRTVHVAAPAFAAEGAGYGGEPLDQARADLDAMLAVQELNGSTPQPCVRIGEAAHEIVAEAREWGADLVVLGTHGRRGAARWLLGSVAETVLRTAPCSVLVVPPVRAPYDYPAALAEPAAAAV
ncbi:MAG TPA: universal stress protein [Longimicrobium sp.]|nr:universal stress protein [Longimicrobium sp.]